MTIAYLVNHYPKVSHSFIRREILGLEEAGVSVRRFTLRPPDKDLPDPQDQAEAAKTEVVLGQGAATLLLATFAQLFRHPGRWFRAFRIAWGMGQGAPARIARQMAYLVEACWLAGRMEGIQHLHAHFGTNPAAVARLTHILAGVPYSFTVHGPEEFDGPLMLDLPGKIADARYAVAISSFGRSQLMRWTDPKHWAKLLVVRCGVDAIFAKAAPQPLVEAPELSCVARLSGQKGLPLLIEAAALLKQRGVDFRLTVVGDGEMRREIEQQIAGTPELVNNQCGWLIPAGAIEPLADAMQAALAAKPEDLRAMGEVGRARVLEQHDALRNARMLGEAVGAL